jgi:hypothetical protein
MRHKTLMGRMIHTNKVLVRKSEGMKPTERPRGRWEDNIKIGL